MKVVTISSKNQITLPAQVLAHLGVSAHDKALVEKQGDTIVVTPLKTSVVDQVSGSLRSQIPQSKQAASLKEIDQTVRKKVAKKLAEE
jgi:bifunctional DNA-binding transcriptional regulator/antitoxin component of YhaV-PrlF toxin-antitoxin module